MLFRGFLTILLAVTSYILFNTNICSANPGLRVQVTKKTIDYVNGIALKKLYQMMFTSQIPNLTYNRFITAKFTNMKPDSISTPDGNVAFLRGHGLKWVINIKKLTIKGKWDYSKDMWFFSVHLSGSFEAYFRDSEIEITTSIAKAHNGGLNITASKCSSFTKAEVLFDRWGMNILWNIFKNTFTNVLEGMICDKVVSVVNNNAAQVISRYPVTYPFAENYVFDYGLESNPVIGSNYIQTNHKAIISYKNDRRIIPFTAKPLPNISDNNKMVYFIISNYVLDTMLFSANENNVFKYNVNIENVPADSREFFYTTCPHSFCIGTILPQLAVNFPNKTIEIYFSTFARPRAYFEPDMIRQILPVQLHVSVLQPNMPKIGAVNIYLNVSTEMKVQFKNNNFTLTIANISFALDKLSGAYANNFNATTVEKGLQTMSNLLTPFINKTTVVPIVLPPRTSIVNPEFRIVNTAIIASTDLKIELI